MISKYQTQAGLNYKMDEHSNLMLRINGLLDKAERYIEASELAPDFFGTFSFIIASFFTDNLMLLGIIMIVGYFFGILLSFSISCISNIFFVNILTIFGILQKKFIIWIIVALYLVFIMDNLMLMIMYIAISILAILIISNVVSYNKKIELNNKIADQILKVINI